MASMDWVVAIARREVMNFCDLVRDKLDIWRYRYGF